MLTELKITCLTGDLYSIKGTLPKLFYLLSNPSRGEEDV